MRALNNLSITAKSLLASLLGAIVVLGMVGLFGWSYVEFQKANDMTALSVAGVGQAREARTDFSRAHAALYRPIERGVRAREIGSRFARLAHARDRQGGHVVGLLELDVAPAEEPHHAENDDRAQQRGEQRFGSDRQVVQRSHPSAPPP